MFALLLCVALQEGYGQSTGDIAVIGFNSDGDDDFAAVTFTEFSEGDEVHFSSEEWNGSAFDGPGGHLTWVAPEGGISAGTVLIFNEVGGTPTVNVGSIIDDININLSGSGDVIYAYIGSSQDAPDAFLGATATSSDQYDGADGTLNNTGLSQGSTAILLTENIDVAEFKGSRSGNTQSVYQAELNDIENWIEDNGTGDQSETVIPFDNTSFTLVDPPTIAFSSQFMTVSEDDGVINLTVELVESDNTEVDVDIAFLGGSSTATNGNDFDSYSTQTVSFSDSDGDNTTKTVSINLTDDSDFEGSEKAIFQLQNISDGTVIGPDVLTLTIEDDDAPDIVINEFMADPGGEEINNDDNQSNTDDEFIEIVNNETSDIDISNWTVSDADNVQFTFPSGTVVGAERAILIFSGGEPSGSFGGAHVFTSSGLSLNNAGDTITLEDENGHLINEVSYSSSSSGVSLNRDSDGIGNDESFINHDELAGANGNFSPGTKVDGTAFGSKYAIGLRGSAGWRMISTPTENTSFSDLVGNLWMQGISGSDDPSGDLTLAGWSEDQASFTVPSDMSNDMSPGKGYIVYVFEDDEFNTPGIQGGFPKVISTDGNENGSTVNKTVSATNSDGENGIDGDEGWNLLGNPFGTDLSVGSLISALEDIDSGVNANIYVWDHEANSGNGEYITLSDGDRIAPFQAFFVRFTNEVSDETFTFDKNELEANTGTEFYKNNTEDSFAFDVQLHGEEYFDTYSIEFSENGSVDLDRYDAYKLFSLNANSINLFSTHGDNRLQKNVLPKDLETNLEIPLSFEANGRSNLTFQWDNIDDLPNDWDVMLIDKEENREIDLHAAEEYQFTVLSADQEETVEKQGLLNKRKGSDEDARFVLSVSPNLETSSGSDIPESVKLNPNYPNPFNPTTTIPYEIAEDAEVKLTIWNMIGQKVATLVDGMVEAGTHEETWNANNMPSGIYIARFEVGNEVFTRKMTLIK